MKKLNKKGFTLIELLAVIIILGVLLLIAVPAVNKYIQQSRIKTYKTQLSKFVDAVTIEVNGYDNDDYSFSSEQYLVVPFVCIDLERGSNTKSPFSAYEPKKSYVVVTRDANGFNYQVAALDNTGFGTELVDADKAEVSSIGASASMPAISTTSGLSITIPGATGTAKVVSCDALK